MKHFLVHYAAGARGDFLVNLLRTKQNIKTYYSFPPENIVKIHGIKQVWSIGVPHAFEKDGQYSFNNYDEVFDFAKTHNLTTIKIIGESFEEQLDISYFNWIKNMYLAKRTNLRYAVTIDEFKKFIMENRLEFINELKTSGVANMCTNIYDILGSIQNEDILYRDRYDYIVTFDELFDVNFIKNLYQQINQIEMPNYYVEKVKYNIDIQDRLTKSNNYQAFVELYQNFLRVQQLVSEIS